MTGTRYDSQSGPGSPDPALNEQEDDQAGREIAGIQSRPQIIKTHSVK